MHRTTHWKTATAKVE